MRPKKASRSDELAIARRKKRLQKMRESLDGLADMYEHSKQQKNEVSVLGEIARAMAFLRPSLVLSLFEKSKKVPLSKGPTRILKRLERQAERMRDVLYPYHGLYCFASVEIGHRPHFNK